MRKTQQRLEKPISDSGIKVVDTTLDISLIVLSTLRDASKIAVPLLSTTAGIAINIVEVAQKARRNKNGLKALANDSCELVYVIVRAHKDISSAEDMPRDLTENLHQLVRTLTSIQMFAETGASRNFLTSMLRSGVDAERIQEYREKLRQSMRVFGVSTFRHITECVVIKGAYLPQLQSDIILRETVAKLASRQVKMMNELKARATPDSSRPNGNAHVSSSTSSSSSSSVRHGPQTPVGTSRDAKLGKASTTTINPMVDNEPSDTGNSVQTYGGMVTIGIAGAGIGITMFVIHRVFRRLWYRSLGDL
ncbi:hypothetical protein F5887DRAFT_1282952 [Amanita rubescens]|nr:hypothetical protein F5887DRAFT_1282952 [Amanita rubescens]